MIEFPKKTFDAAVHGLDLWRTVLFPSLLPFFILSELLIGLGIVHVFGLLLEPLMRPLFRVPGTGAFALSIGLASGYPMDAVITCKFRKNKLCTRTEAERLLAFTNTADPLFMFSAVAVGMFAAPEAGIILASAHYTASFLVGIIFRFYGKKEANATPSPRLSLSPKNLLRELHIAREKDGRSFGVLLGDAVKSSMNTIILIGGFIILFSVFLDLLSETPLSSLLILACTEILEMLNFSPDLAKALHDGLFEIDIGALSASKTDAPLNEKLCVVSAIIAWSGLSVHGQVASIVSEAKISMKPYIAARIIHALIAAMLAYIFSTSSLFYACITAVPASTDSEGLFTAFFTLSHFQQGLLFMLLSLLLLIFLSIVIYLMRRIYIVR
jgi:sporulation integral membrane protein YlbJ